jgi:hypothetical protein
MTPKKTPSKNRGADRKMRYNGRTSLLKSILHFDEIGPKWAAG